MARTIARYVAEVLALVWGGFWVFFVAATGLTEGVGTLKGA